MLLLVIKCRTERFLYFSAGKFGYAFKTMQDESLNYFIAGATKLSIVIYIYLHGVCLIPLRRSIWTTHSLSRPGNRSGDQFKYCIMYNAYIRRLYFGIQIIDYHYYYNYMTAQLIMSDWRLSIWYQRESH
jgi:hypothetical protein